MMRLFLKLKNENKYRGIDPNQASSNNASQIESNQNIDPNQASSNNGSQIESNQNIDQASKRFHVKEIGNIINRLEPDYEMATNCEIIRHFIEKRIGKDGLMPAGMLDQVLSPIVYVRPELSDDSITGYENYRKKIIESRKHIRTKDSTVEKRKYTKRIKKILDNDDLELGATQD